MRVLHVLNGPIGGATVGALELMRASRDAKSGTEHYAVYPGLGRGEGHPAVRAVAADAREVPMRWWSRKVYHAPVRRAAVRLREAQVTRLDRATRKALREAVRAWGIDLIHTNTAAVDAGAIASRDLCLPHVWHVRERIGSDGFMRFALPDQALADRITGLSDTVVAMSRFVGEFFVRHGHAVSTKVVYDGVDPALFDTDDARRRGRALRRSWGVPDDALLVGKVAAVTSQVKRHDVFLRAAGRVARRDPRARFAIVGVLPEPGGWGRRDNHVYRERLAALARQEGLDGRLVWTGDVPDAPAVMNALDVLAHACDLEGFGRVAIEAMAAGKPAVGPDAGGFRESVMQGRTGLLVAPGDPGALAEGIEALLADPEMRQRMGDAGRERSRTAFSPAAHLDAMLAIYRDALHGHASRSDP